MGGLYYLGTSLWDYKQGIKNICNKNKGWVWQDWKPTALKEVRGGSKMPFQVETPGNHFLSGTCWTWEQPSGLSRSSWLGGMKELFFFSPHRWKDMDAPLAFQHWRKDSADLTWPCDPPQVIERKPQFPYLCNGDKNSPHIDFLCGLCQINTIKHVKCFSRHPQAYRAQ